MEMVQVDFQNAPNFGTRATATIPRNGDLLGEVFLVFRLPKITQTAQNGVDVSTDPGSLNYWGWTNKVGYALINDVTLDIGGQQYDRHYGEFYDVWDELTQKSTKKNLETIGDIDNMGLSDADAHQKRWFMASADEANRYLYIPLKFWFNNTVSMALPMVALSFHDVKLTFNFRARDKLVRYYGPSDRPDAQKPVPTYDSTSIEAYLLCNYVYLDAPERVTFGSGSEIEYLIDQLQFEQQDFSSSSVGTMLFNISFNHPIKELVFVIRSKTRTDTTNDYFNYAPDGTYNGSGVATKTSGAITYSNQVTPDYAFQYARIRFNGHDRFAKQPTTFWKTLMPAKVHSNIPSKNIFVFSFALDPESEKPTGTANFSRIDQITLNLEWIDSAFKNAWPNGGQVLLFGRSYNVIKIVNGMAGIKYAS